MTIHIPTPLIESNFLASRDGPQVWLKLENLQPCGSFKARGIGHACQAYARQGAQRFIASSGGNAGLAVALAGRKLQLPVTIFVPTSTSERAKALIRAEGAELVVTGASWHEAHRAALAHTTPQDIYIHPFDDPLIWTGHATLIDEVVAAGVRPDVIILSVGGGGLLCGVLEGLHRHGLRETRVLAAETVGAASFHLAAEADQLVSLDKITSVATSLGAKQVAQRALDWHREHPINSVVVSDRAALEACAQLLDTHRLLVEPACGAALAVLEAEWASLQHFEQIVVIVCGGVTMTATQLNEWLQLAKAG